MLGPPPLSTDTVPTAPPEAHVRNKAPQINGGQPKLPILTRRVSPPHNGSNSHNNLSKAARPLSTPDMMQYHSGPGPLSQQIRTYAADDGLPLPGRHERAILGECTSNASLAADHHISASRYIRPGNIRPGNNGFHKIPRPATAVSGAARP